MKKIVIKSILLGLLSLFIISCSKDDDTPSFTSEKFFDNFLENQGFNELEAEFVDSGDYEFGLEFTPKVTGEITELIVKIPDANDNLRITLWDTGTQSIIKSESVNVERANEEFIFNVNEFNLIKDTKYAITMNSDDWYRLSKTSNEDANYPVSVGNITIESYGYHSGSEQTYPDRFYDNYYAGNLHFTFQQTE